MNDMQMKIADLQSKGWTLAAIADEVGVTINAVEKWKAGDRYPANSKAVIGLLEKIGQRKRIPKKRRYGRKRLN
jgi:transcriptional regulator with XRE-family HTH domain